MSDNANEAILDEAIEAAYIQRVEDGSKGIGGILQEAGMEVTAEMEGRNVAAETFRFSMGRQNLADILREVRGRSNITLRGLELSTLESSTRNAAIDFFGRVIGLQRADKDPDSMPQLPDMHGSSGKKASEAIHNASYIFAAKAELRKALGL